MRWLRITAVTLIASVTPYSLVDLEKNLRENQASKTMDMQENYLKTIMKEDDDLPFVDPSSHGFIQDFHDDQFPHVNGGSSSNNNPPLGLQTPNIGHPFDNLTCGCSQGGLDVYQCKHFVENDDGNGGHAHVIDNFQYDGYSLDLHRKNDQMDMMAVNQSYLPFNPDLDIKPLNFVAPDEISCICPANYYKGDDMDKDNRASTITRRTLKLQKKSNMVKGQWTVEEDRLLIQLVEQYGLRKWSLIAQALPGRIGKQCRERWHNHLRPDIKKDIWTEEEDKILIHSHAELGNKWAEIAKRLPGRTENSIKNHWNATKRRQYSKRKCRSKYPRGSLLQEYIKSLNLDQNPPIDYRKRSSGANAKAMTNNNTSTSKAASPSHANDRLVPNYDNFNEVPDLCFDDSLFIQDQECGIDSLLDDVSCVPSMDNEKDFDGKMQCGGGGPKQFDHVVKKELDLVEMMSQVNQNIDE